MDYLIRKFDNDILHDNFDEHLLIKRKLHKVLSYTKNTFKNESNLLSWNTYILANRNIWSSLIQLAIN